VREIDKQKLFQLCLPLQQATIIPTLQQARIIPTS
jgi:hypothetical protein